MPASSLLDMSRRLCVKNISHLDDVGDTPYPLIRPILLKLENPDQLRRIEKNSPQIRTHTGEIWFHFIKSDIPGWEKRTPEYKDSTNWCKLYRKLQADVAEERKESEKKLQEALTKHRDAKEESKSTFIPKALDPGKTGRATNLVRYTGDRSNLAFQDGRVIGTKGEAGGWLRGPAPKPKMSTLEKMKKKGGESASGRMATPTHLLANRSSRVTQVPKGMLPPPKPATASTIGQSGLQPKRRTSPPRAPVKIFAPGRAPKSQMQRQLDLEVSKEKERRLKAIQMGQGPNNSKPSTKPTTPPATAGSPSAKATTPAPVSIEKAHTPEKSVPLTANTPLNNKKRKLESVFVSKKKSRV
ncbi:MAG: hypothetical protein Q9165_006754 [Trypethelium subeluteriae]